MNRLRLSVTLLASIFLLAACSHVFVRASRPTRPSRDIVASIRAAGTQDKSAIEVQPLRDPAVQQLTDAAHADEAAGHYRQAANSIDEALKLTPKSPDLLQYRAELAVWLHDYVGAVRYANQSFLLGPRLGSLCKRNWQTILEIRQVSGDEAGAKSARAQRDKCQVNGPVRM